MEVAAPYRPGVGVALATHNLLTVYSSRMTGRPVDIPNPGLWLQATADYNPTAGIGQPASTLCPHPHPLVLGAPGNWKEGNRGMQYP